MRTLTDAEARVISVLLAAPPTRERERLRQIDVPRSTYHAARKRAYEEGWLDDRYVPDPLSFGFPIVSFLLVRPYADRLTELMGAWDRAPGNVLTWGSSQLALGVFYHRSARESAAVATVVEGKYATWTFSLPVRTDRTDLPVYFDYEGLWSHLASMEGASGYPHGLGGRSPGSSEDPPALTTGQRWGAKELVLRPFVAASEGRPGHLVGPLGLPWGQQKLLRAGIVGHRVFLRPSKVPPFRGRAADHVTFITGDLTPSTRPEVLFATLTRDCLVFPFLFAVADRRVLIAALGHAAPAGAAPFTTSRRPVLETLRAMLTGIELSREAVANLVMPVDHRYDRLVTA